jgi:DNA-binding transcriptional regulator YiaG
MPKASLPPPPFFEKNEMTDTNEKITVRPECFRRADDGWERPTGAEIREIMRQAELTDSKVARLVGVSFQSAGGSRRVRKWTSEESEIPYAAWALLCHAAGLGIIWVDEKE